MKALLIFVVSPTGRTLIGPLYPWYSFSEKVTELVLFFECPLIAAVFAIGFRIFFFFRFYLYLRTCTVALNFKHLNSV